MQMVRSKVGSRKKQRRSAKDKPYYERFRTRYSGKLIRRRGQREKRIAFFAINPGAGSPSQVRLRRKVERRKQRLRSKQNAI